MPFPVAAAVGIAAANLIGNQLNAAADAEQKEQGRRYLSSAAGSADTQYVNLLNQINDYYGQRGSLGTADDANKYAQAIRDYDVNGAAYMPGEFNYGRTIESFESPYKEAMLGDVVSSIQHSAAGAGLGRGSGAAGAIAQGVLDKSLELRREANSEYQADRTFEYSKYNDYIRNMNQALAQRQQALNNKLTLQGNLAQDYYGAMDARQSDIMGATQDRIATGTQYSTAMAGLY
jgi:hypothetical protein